MLNPLHLRTLSAVVRTGSFAEAARELGYTPSAVSQQVSALERAIGIPLFERAAHSVRTADAARFIAERGAELLAALEGLEEEIGAFTSGRLGRLRLGTFPTAGARVVPHAIASLTRERPDAEILLDENEPDDCLPAVLRGDLDIALVYAYDLVPRTWPDELTVTPLLEETLVVLLPTDHGAARGDRVRLESLREATWIASRDGSAGSTCLLRLCAAHDFVPRIAYRSNDYDVVQGLVSAGVGVALVPALGHQPASDLRALRPTGDAVRRGVLALHRTANTNPLLAPALAALTAACGAVAGEFLTPVGAQPQE
ncbi:LysR family transcriptional regulator [Allokutzneria sp. A3M-2-11 16]|uniref:LysR family transcriptional regulator n=1 Tax=Allokutzneria sp. A3M-2-11 16 TaxID=2962043 RepID=UPI0020B6C507|nr:LysR family transcriptional regulator [Allokutzneria sp. A3M-2-11 16]MCP3802977.1 LysR family transcriptional regulator [Allokutzneria sp. A3M-2-11 16]